VADLDGFIKLMNNLNTQDTANVAPDFFNQVRPVEGSGAKSTLAMKEQSMIDTNQRSAFDMDVRGE